MSEKKIEDQEPGEQSLALELRKRLKILFLPFFILLLAVGLFRFFSPPEVRNDRAPSSIGEVEPLSVPTALKTILKISGADYDKLTTSRIRRTLESGVVPQMLEKSSPSIVEKIKKGEMKFYSFKVLDSIDDDGDEVEISIDGEPFSTFVLSQAEVRLSIPIEFGKSKLLTIKAVRDAGDGITFGAKLINAEFLLDNILVGESDTVYLGFIK